MAAHNDILIYLCMYVRMYKLSTYVFR